jgi:hypothetical protein
MHDTNKSLARTPRCPNCARPMQLLRRTSRFGGLPDRCSFYCCACDQWHVEEVAPIKFMELDGASPAIKQIREKGRGHDWR